MTAEPVRESTEDLVAGLLPRLYNTAYYLARDPQQAEDAVQATLLKFLEARRQDPDGIHSPLGWCLRVLARDHWKGNAVGRARPLNEGLVSEGEGPEDLAISQERRRLVRQAVATLPGDEKEALSLHVFGDLPVREVASTLGLSVGSTHERIQRGLVKLRKSLESTALPAMVPVGLAGEGLSEWLHTLPPAPVPATLHASISASMAGSTMGSTAAAVKGGLTVASASSKSVLIGACVVFAATSIGVGVTNHRLRAENEALNASLRAGSQAAAKNLEAIRAQDAVRQAELVKAQEALKIALAGQKAAMEKCAALEAKAAAPTPRVAEAPKKKRGSWVRKMAEAQKQLMNDPFGGPAYRNAVSSGIELKYKDLFKEWGLVDDIKSKVIEALVDRDMGLEDMKSLIYDEAVKEDDVLRRQAEITAKATTALEGLLSGGQMIRLEAYEKELSDRTRAHQMDQKLAGLSLQPPQQEQMKTILLEELRAEQRLGIEGPSSPLTTDQIRQTRQIMFGEGVQTQDLNQALKEMAEARERTYIQVQSFLSPEQFETFKKQHENEAKNMEMFLKATLSMMGRDASTPGE